jgi:hypothetical protein
VEYKLRGRWTAGILAHTLEEAQDAVEKAAEHGERARVCPIHREWFAEVNARVEKLAQKIA